MGISGIAPEVPIFYEFIARPQLPLMFLYREPWATGAITFKHVLESLVSFHAEYCQASILTGLCQSEEYRPKNTFCCSAYR